MLRTTTLTAALLSATAIGAQAQDLRIALQSDADVLDPDQSRTFVGRIVYASLCDKLVDITPISRSSRSLRPSGNGPRTAPRSPSSCGRA